MTEFGDNVWDDLADATFAAMAKTPSQRGKPFLVRMPLPEDE